MLSTQIDRAIASAHAYPRNLTGSVNMIETMATRNADTAKACRFRKPIGGGEFAEGGSIRLAEIVGVCWGNLAVDPPIVMVGERHVEAHVVCRDLQTNVSFAGSCTKSLLYSKKGQRAGQRFTEDMVATAVAAAISTAKRNAILSTVPRVFWEPILAKCKAIVAGTIKDLSRVVTTTFDALASKGIDRARVLASLGRDRVEDVTAEDVADLRSTAEAIKSGELTLEEAFPPIEAARILEPGESRSSPGKAANAAAKLRATLPQSPDQPNPTQTTKPLTMPQDDSDPTDGQPDAESPAQVAAATNLGTDDPCLDLRGEIHALRTAIGVASNEVVAHWQAKAGVAVGACTNPDVLALLLEDLRRRQLELASDRGKAQTRKPAGGLSKTNARGELIPGATSKGF